MEVEYIDFDQRPTGLLMILCNNCALKLNNLHAGRVRRRLPLFAQNAKYAKEISTVARLSEVSDVFNGEHLPLVKPEDAQNEMLNIKAARVCDTKFGKRVVFDCNASTRDEPFAIMLGHNEARQSIVDFLKDHKGEIIGPVILKKGTTETEGGNAPWLWVDVDADYSPEDEDDLPF